MNGKTSEPAPVERSRPGECHTLLLVAVAFGLVLRLIAIFTAPLHEPSTVVPSFNDEASHLNHVYFQAQRGGLAHQRMAVGEEYALTRGEVEYSQPPLYYQLAALLTHLVPKQRELYALRLFSLLLWGFALAVLVRNLPDKGWKVPVVLGGTVLGAGMIPSTTVTNDALLALFIALIYAESVRIVRGDKSTSALIRVSALAALAIWTKLSALLLLPVIIAALLLSESRTRDSRKWVQAVILLFFTFVGTLPLWIARIQVYGSPLGVEHSSSGLVFDPKSAVIAAIYTHISPYMELWGSWFVKLPALLFVFAGYGGLLVLAVRFRSWIGSLNRETRNLLISWSVGAVLVLVSWLVYAVRYYQADVRLLLPAAPALAVWMGWPFWNASRQIRMLIGWSSLLLLLLPYLAWGLR